MSIIKVINNNIIIINCIYRALNPRLPGSERFT